MKNYLIKRGLLLFAAYLFYLISLEYAFAKETDIEDKNIIEVFSSHITFSPQEKNIIGHIVIEDQGSSINQSTWLYVKKALEYYKETKPIFIILELNTPGGEVYAAQKISDALQEIDTQLNIPIVAYVNNWAISAGAMLAYSCRYIVVAKDASMGAAEPVIEGADGKMEAASEKINSVLRADFANRARFFNRDPLIAEAMVDKDLILVVREGKVIKLDNESQIISSTDKVLSPKGKLLTLDAEQMIQLKVADLSIPPTKVTPITESEKELGKWNAGQMAIFHQPFFDQIPDAFIDSYKMDWKTKFFAFLSLPLISSLLMLGLTIGFYMEVSSPGFGLPGTIAVTSLFLIALSSFSLEIGNWLELIFVLMGLLVILLELFVLPSFGFLLFIGIILFFAGLFGMMIPGFQAVDFDFDSFSINPAGHFVLSRLLWLSATLVVSFFSIILIARYITPKITGWNHFVLKGNEQTGYTSHEHLKSLPKLCAKGIVFATLRPAGKVIIEDELYDALSESSFIEKGEAIRVTGLDAGTLIVTKDTVN